MINRVASVGLALCCLALVPAGAAAQPGAEQKKLDALVGQWRIEIDVKPTATTAAGKASGTESCEWFADLHVVCRAEASGAGGVYRSMRTFSYLPATRRYVSYSIDSLGYAVLTAGQVAGTTWTFSSEGSGFNVRSVLKTTKDAYTATSEYAGRDGKWTAASVVTATRAR
jgi:hypothetical protein